MIPNNNNNNTNFIKFFHCCYYVFRLGRSAGLFCVAGAWAETRMFLSTTRVTMPKSPFASLTCTAASRWTQASPSNAKSFRTALCSTSRQQREPSTWWQKQRRKWTAGCAPSANCADSTSQRTTITVGELSELSEHLCLCSQSTYYGWFWLILLRNLCFSMEMYLLYAIIYGFTVTVLSSGAMCFFFLWADDTIDRKQSEVTWCHILLLSFPPTISFLCHLRKLGWTSPAKWMQCLKGLLIFFFFFSPFVLLKKREGTLPIIAGILLCLF